GQAYRDFLREKVFLPLGMTRSSVDVAPELEPFAATRYGSDQVSYPHYDFDHPGGSAVYCSAHDLLRFGMFHAGTPLPDQKEILTPETRQEMQRPTSLRGPGEYGFGWNVQADDCGVRSVSHSGGMGGVNTLLKVVPEAGIVIVTLCNAACRLPFLAAEEILARLLPTYAGRLAEKRATPPEPSPDADPPQLLPGEWSGYVDLPEGSLPFQLRVRGNGDLHARVGEQLWALVNDVLLEHQTLTGRFAGDLGTEDTRKRPGYLHLDLQMQERQMLGALVARSELPGPQGGAPARRMGNALSHWCLLERRST
ncbi:MAG: beta-lactamase family protein, partial [SAR202 cluster bacterium]|nr:beta-lactamase family protein [SAR202 cluster bacterium]